MTEDYYFWSHRLPVARAARDAGFEVHVATHVHEFASAIKQEGFILHPTRFERSNRNLWNQFLALLELVRLFRSVRPQIVHNVALKAIVFGTIAARFSRVPKVVNLVAGMGAVFTSEERKYRLASMIARVVGRVLFGFSNTVVTVQNSDDLREIKSMVPNARVELIRGSGVNINHFIPSQEPEGSICVTLVGRMLWHKGVGEFVEASRILRDSGFRMQLVGGIDLHNPAAISKEQLQLWQSEGHIFWLGHQKNINEIWSQSHVAVLPSYREGLPKSLLEAASCGRPIIVADSPGCREIVQEGYNGFLVPKGDARALAKAILKLGLNRALREEMGRRSRQMVEEHFCEGKIVEQTLELYQRDI